MHVLKNKIVATILAASFSIFVGCAGNSQKSSEGGNALANALGKTAAEKDAKFQGQEQDKLAMLESMFDNFKAAVKSNVSADTLLNYLTDSSEYWLDTLENHAKTYNADALDTCMFYEAYAIILYRLFEREHLWEMQDDRMLYLLLSKSKFLDLVNRVNVGPFEVKNDRGSVGLAKSPKVPIMLFEWDDSAWKLNLVETLPLITKGIEATASKKSWTGAKLALYWLDKEYHMQYTRLDESLFEPIGF